MSVPTRISVSGKAWIALTFLGPVMSLSGCQQTSRPDWEIYAEVMERSPPVVADLDLCAQLDDPNLGPECAMMVAIEAARAEGLPADALCPRVQQGLWQDECYFWAAENLRTEGKIDAAQAACREAGRFASNCALHLWKRAMNTLVGRYGSLKLTDMETSARQMYARWHARVGDFSDFETRFWPRLYRQVWSQPGPVDAHRCAVLSVDLQDACEVGAVVALDQVLRVKVRDPVWSLAFCSGPAASSGALHALPGSGDGLRRYVAHPRLDALVQSFHSTTCNDQIPPPPPRDPPPAQR